MVSTPLKNIISQIGNLPQVGVKIQNLWNHQPVYIPYICTYFKGLVIPYFSPSRICFINGNGPSPATWVHLGMIQALNQPIVQRDSMYMSCIYTWNSKQPFVNGCLVKQQFFFSGCFRFQVCISVYTLQLMIDDLKHHGEELIHFMWVMVVIQFSYT